MKARRLLFAAVFAAVPAFAQQNVDISGKDFESGAGDAKFATLGRQAAASGKRIVVTAPAEWHAKIAAKIRSGGAADVVLKDGFYENVLVRVEDKPAEPPKPEPPKAEPRPEPKPAPRPAAERFPVDVPGPKPTLPPPAPAPAPQAAPVVTTHPPAPVAPPVAVKQAPAPAPTAVKQTPVTAPAPPAPAKPDVAKIQKGLEQSLNNGREAEGPLSVSGLQAGDFIFVDGPVRAVVRRESLRPRMFWLDGELELRRTELKELGPNRYQVIEPIRGDIYSLRDERSDQPKQLIATEPPDNSPVRASFERDYNDGHPIGGSITVEKLHAGDIVYAGKSMAVVVRREGQALTRFWLEGTLDLGQPGLQKDGANKYKVISDTLR
jgi:hypothetical protein